MATISPDFLTPPDDPNAVDPNADPNYLGALDDRGDGGYSGPSLPGPNDAQVAAAAMPDPSDPTNRKGIGQDATANTGPTPTPYELLSSTLPGPQIANPTTPDDILRNALGANPGPAQHPQTAEAMAFQNANPNGGSFPNPNPGSGMSVEQQVFQSKYPGGGSFNNQGAPVGSGLPGPGGTPGAGPTGAMGNDPWEQEFRKENGFFDARYNSKENFLHNAQMGDQVIRHDSQGNDELARMAKFDPDAARVLAGLEGPGKGIYGSQLGADWASGHNTDIVAEMKAAVAGKNMAALENLKAQLANVPANPQTNQEAFPVAAQIAADLNTLGATNIRMNGTTISYAPKSDPNATAHIIGGDAIPLASWVDVAAYLHNAVTEKQKADAAAAAQPQAPATGGYGRNYPARGGAAPRGGGGSQQQTAPPETAVGTGNPSADALAAQRLGEFFPTPESRVGVPRSVASAVGYMPSVLPGGFSPYDEP